MEAGMKKQNLQLTLGLLLLAAIAVISLMGSRWAPHERDYSDNLVYIETEKGSELFISPVPPMREYPLGIDHYGRDILSVMLHGAKFSLGITVVAALFRVIFATAIVVLTGLSKADKSKTGKTSSHLRLPISGLNAVPQFIIIYFILFSINFNSSLSVPLLTLLQLILLVAFGVPGLVPSISEYVTQLHSRDFVTAARSNGAGPWRILRVHILPHMKEKILLLLSQETVSVLTLVGQLGIFNIFIGGTIFTPAPPIYHSITHEWAGLVGQYRYKLHPGTWWILLFPLIGFMIMLLAFYLTSRGLELRVRKKYHSTSYL